MDIYLSKFYVITTYFVTVQDRCNKTFRHEKKQNHIFIASCSDGVIQIGVIWNVFVSFKNMSADMFSAHVWPL